MLDDESRMIALILLFMMGTAVGFYVARFLL